MDGPKKLAEYIKYREDWLAQIVNLVDHLSSTDDRKPVSHKQLYSKLYGRHNPEGLVGKLACHNLDQMLKLCMERNKLSRVTCPDQ